MTDQAEVGDGRVFLGGTASRRGSNGEGFTHPFGAVVTVRDGRIQAIQTSADREAVRAELGLTPPGAPVA